MDSKAAAMIDDMQRFMELSHLHGTPSGSGRLRCRPEDFVVEEDLGFEPDGAGQHWLLHVEKRSSNTEWVARRIARFAEIAPRDVGFAGLKDRHAVTRQWFSVDLAGRPAPDWSALNDEAIRVLEAAPHGRKLRRGALRGNRFRLRARELEGDASELADRLERVGREGVPNYFMEQRFGHDDENLRGAAELFAGRRIKDRHRRGLYLSAARSLLFNRVLSERIARGHWETILQGDVLMLDGTHSVFVADVATEGERLQQRLAAKDLHITGPLWGSDPMNRTAGEAFELDALAGLESFREGLERADMKAQRRALRVLPADFSFDIDGDTLEIVFALPAGSYATAVLRELLIAR